MKMNAFLRLIRTIACGVIVLGASTAIGQTDDTGATFGTLQPADENGNDIPGVASPTPVDSSAQTLTQAPAQGSGSKDAALVPSYSAPLYPPGTEIPLTETEIPGSSYFVGPDGERIDASTLMNQVPVGPQGEIPLQDSLPQYSSGQSFSPDGVYDGTQSFPMGTFPTTPFGERIISEVPSEGSSSVGEIPGALVEGDKASSMDKAGGTDTPGSENGVPLDQIVKPDNSPTQDEMKKAADNAAGSGQARSVVEKARTMPKTDIGDAPKAEPRQMVDRRDQVKQRLKNALGERARLDGLLRKANEKTKALTMEVKQLKEDAEKSNGMMKKQLEIALAEKNKLVKQMKSAKDGSQAESGKKVKGLERKLKQVEKRHKEKMKVMQTAAKEEQKKMQKLLSEKAEAMKKAQAAEGELAKTKAQMKTQLADAKTALFRAEKKATEAQASVVAAKAEASSMAEKMAAAMAAKSVTEMSKPAVLEAPGVMNVDAAQAANEAADAKAAAEREVKLRLEEAEKAKKAAQEAEDAANAKSEKMNSDEQAVLSLDDQIKRLKAKRDQQIAESETRIRAKRQREIDELIKEGKAVDSDEVKTAVQEMKGAIKTSEEKLRSRFLRRLERLKEDMKKRLK